MRKVESIAGFETGDQKKTPKKCRDWIMSQQKYIKLPASLVDYIAAKRWLLRLQACMQCDSHIEKIITDDGYIRELA